MEIYLEKCKLGGLSIQRLSITLRLITTMDIKL